MYAGCCSTSKHSLFTVSMVALATCGRALLCCSKTFFDSISRRLVRIAGLGRLASKSQYLALLIVLPFSRKCSEIGPLESRFANIIC